MKIKENNDNDDNLHASICSDCQVVFQLNLLRRGMPHKLKENMRKIMRIRNCLETWYDQFTDQCLCLLLFLIKGGKVVSFSLFLLHFQLHLSAKGKQLHRV